jgi:hypothetical protein
MKTMGFFVQLSVPNNMNPAKVGEEIRTSIAFGRAQVTPLFQFPEQESKEETSAFQDPPGLRQHREMLAHDGYATHSHEVRQDHLGVHRKEWGDNV